MPQKRGHTAAFSSQFVLNGLGGREQRTIVILNYSKHCAFFSIKFSASFLPDLVFWFCLLKRTKNFPPGFLSGVLMRKRLG